MPSRKVAPALAAGCSVVLKPSEFTPFSSLALCDLADQAGLPSGLFNVVTGDAKIIGEEITRHKDVHKLTFTGSTRVGKLLMSQCAETVKKLSLELGGSSSICIYRCSNVD